MNIFYISSSSFPSRQANAVHVISMCRALSKLGHIVTLFIRSDYNGVKNLIFNNYEIESHTIKIIETISIFKRGTELFIALKALSKFLSLKRSEKNSYIIIARNIFAALFFSFTTQKNIIYETHIQEITFIRRFIQKFLLKKKNVRTIVISQALKSIIISNYNIKTLDKKVKVLHDGAFDDVVPFTKDAKISKRKAFFSNLQKMNNFECFVGYFGHLYPGRGIEIIEKLSNIHNKSLFLVFGGQDEEILRYKNNNKASNLIFMGHVNYRNVKNIMSLMDVLLMPYQKSVSISLKSVDTASWMSPIKMFEYMSVGLPIISSDLPVLREILIDRNNCLLVKPDDINDWSIALSKLIEDKNLAYNLGQSAYNNFRNNYTWENRAKKMINFLD